jgi:riboflavin biosynthesis pyrimidine reductase
MVEIVSLLPDLGGALDDTAIADHYSAGVGSTWLRVNFVASVDGAATVDGRSGGLGDDADHRVFALLRTLCDVVIVAAGTLRTEGYGALVLDKASVAARIANGLKPQPTLAIVSAALDLDATSEMFAKAPVRPVVFTVASAPRKPALSKVADVVICGEELVDPKDMVRELVARGLGRMHCEGGPTLFASLLEADVVDELCLTVSPMLVGGDSTRISGNEEADIRRMRLAGILRSDDTLLLRYLRR